MRAKINKAFSATLFLIFIIFLLEYFRSITILFEYVKAGHLLTFNRSPVILFWNTMWGDPPLLNTTLNCPVQCTYTNNKSLAIESDAIVLFMHDRFDPLPDLNASQKLVFHSHEGPWYLNETSGGRWWKHITNFHWIMSYATKAHVQKPYHNFIVEPEEGRRRNFQIIANFSKEQVLADKQIRGALWLVSNCRSKERNDVVDALKRHFRVDVGGECVHKNLCPRWQECPDLNVKYYFYLAFENANCMDYMTEKIFNKLEQPVIPIVMKRSVYKRVLPPEAFIAVDDFPNAQKLAEHLTYLMDNPDAYFKLFEWRSKWRKADMNSDGYLQGYCALCDRLHKERDNLPEPIKDIKEWYNENSRCERAVPASWYN